MSDKRNGVVSGRPGEAGDDIDDLDGIERAEVVGSSGGLEVELDAQAPKLGHDVVADNHNLG